MPRRKEFENKVDVGNVRDISGEVNIAAGNIYKGYTVEQVSLLIEQIKSTFRPKGLDRRCPYKGLDVFGEEDADLFFGREKLVDDLVKRVNESRAVFIAGPSGSGKSSLVRAGLIHALRNGAAKNSDGWLYETIKPGRSVLDTLALAFSRLKSPELARYFRKHVDELNVLDECAESILSGRKDQHFLLFVDQFEEIFTQISKETDRLAFINLLTYAANKKDGRVIVLLAMRSDFLSNCAAYPELNDLLNNQFIQIGAMQPDELVSAIAQPALRVGLSVDPDLIAQVIHDMEGEPGALPLMQFALKDLFDSQKRDADIAALTLYDYLKLGGIHKALERHADAAFANLNKNEQELARSIFSGLIEVGRGTQDTCRTAIFDELIPVNSDKDKIEIVVRKLADARLVTTDEHAGKDIVTISHEKLIDAWPWLRKMVNQNREAIALHNEIVRDAKEWEEHRRDAGYLYRGARLANALENLELKKILPGDLALLFIETGAKAYADDLKETKKREFQLQRRSVYLTMTLIVAVFAAITAIFFGVKSQQQVKIALARHLAGEAQSIYEKGNAKQIIGVLLAIQSIKLFPLPDTARILQTNTIAHPISRMSHGEYAKISDVDFSPDGIYVVSGGGEGTVRVWEALSGKEIVRIEAGSWVDSVDFSPNGKYIVSGGCEKNEAQFTNVCALGSIHVWELNTGKEIVHILLSGEVKTVVFSPDGKYIVSSGCETYEMIFQCSQGVVGVWEAMTGDEITQIMHNGEVSSVTFSPNGKYIVSGGCEKRDINSRCSQGIARVWEAMTGKEVTRMIHDGEVSSTVFSPDGRYVVSGGDDFIARVWETSTGQEIAHLKHGGSVNTVAISPDNTHVVSGGSDNIAYVWEVSTGSVTSYMIHDEAITYVAFSPDGMYVVSGSQDGTVRVWQAANGKEVSRANYDINVNDIAFSPNGKYVVIGDWGELGVIVWEIPTVNYVTTTKPVGVVTSVEFSPDGQYLTSDDCEPAENSYLNFLLCKQDTVHVWDAMTGDEIANVVHGGSVNSVHFSPDGKYILSSGCEKRDTQIVNLCIQSTARVWESMTGKKISEITFDGNMYSVRFSPNGRQLMSINGCEMKNDFYRFCEQGSVSVWDAMTGVEISRVFHEGEVVSAAFSPDGKYMVSGGYDNTAIVWETMTGTEVARKSFVANVGSVSYSPDGIHIITSTDDSIHIWEAMTGRAIVRIVNSGHLAGISPDGRRLLSITCDEQRTFFCASTAVHVWDASTGSETSRLFYEGEVFSAAFSPDGRYIVLGGSGGAARIWEATTGKEVALMVHDGTVLSVNFSPDGKYVVSGGVDGIQVWIYRPEDLVNDACSRVTRNLTRAEWSQYTDDLLPYQAICPNLPVEPKLDKNLEDNIDRFLDDLSYYYMDSMNDYYRIVGFLVSVIYLANGWFAYRKVFSHTALPSTLYKPYKSFRNVVAAGGYGGFLVWLILIGLTIPFAIILNSDEISDFPSFYLLLLLLPAGLWSGVVYGYFTRNEVGNFKRMILGGIAGSFGALLSTIFYFLLVFRIKSYFVYILPIEFYFEFSWLLIKGSIIAGVTGGLLSALGTILFVTVLQKRLIKS